MVSSNDPDEPYLEVSLEAFGTEPLIDVDPETLYFGILEVGESSTLDFVVSASGTGDLVVQSMEFESDEGDAYTLDLPESVDLPYTMSAGLSFSVDVTFAPPDDAEWSGTLLVASNDPTTPEVSIALIGNSEDDPTDNADPVVEITDPDAGDYFLQGDSVTVNAVVYDEEDDPESLIVVFYADSTTLGSATPEADGSVTLETEELVPGEVDLVVRAMDSDGQTGEDSVTVKVFDPLEPLEYTISGGDTLFDYWNVDDDVVIMLDGTAIFSDTNDTQDNHPPIEFEAEKGATIRIVATDVNACEQRIDALTLHFGAGYSQELNEEHCASTCSSDACYDSSLSISYPDDFLDEEYVITIP